MSTLASRDTFVVGLLKAATLSGRQGVVQVCSEANRQHIALPGQTDQDTEADIAGLQAAITALANPSTRSATTAALAAAQAGGQLPSWPNSPTSLVGGGPLIYCQNGVDTTAAMYQMRALAGGA
jgi:hypothetical protein